MTLTQELAQALRECSANCLRVESHYDTRCSDTIMNREHWCVNCKAIPILEKYDAEKAGGELWQLVQKWRDRSQHLYRDSIDARNQCADELERALGSGEAAPVAWRYRQKGEPLWRFAQDRSWTPHDQDGFQVEALYAAPPYPTPSAWRRAAKEFFDGAGYVGERHFAKIERRAREIAEGK